MQVDKLILKAICKNKHEQITKNTPKVGSLGGWNN